MTNVLRKTGYTFKKFAVLLGGFIKKHKKLTIMLVVLVLVAAILLNFFGKRASAASMLASAEPQTMTLERMELQQVVTATGTTQSAESREVTSTLSYEITEILVAEGDSVTQGQKLVELDTTDLENSIEEVQSSIAEARRNISDARASDSLQLEQAERKLDDAQNQYSIDKDRLDREVDTARDSLVIAEENLNSKHNALEQAQQDLNSQSAAAEAQAADEPDAFATGAANTASSAYELAQQEYSAAEAEYHAAQQAYNQAVDSRDTTLRNDSISIENARDTINTLKLNDGAKNYQSQLDSYQSQLETYQRQLEKAEITAPISGVVTEVNAAVGGTSGGAAGGTGTASGALFVIEDIYNLEIKASVAEYDVVSLTTGLQVDITSDALDDDSWQGTITDISLKATDSSGNFTVTVSVTSEPGQLAGGMSAKLNMIVDSKANVFAVPYDAVVTGENGQKVVYAYETDGDSGGAGHLPASFGGEMPKGIDGALPPDVDGEAPADLPEGFGGGGQDGERGTRREIVVQTGLQGDYYIEIESSELYEGMTILTDPLGQNVSGDTGMGMGGGMPMMGGF